MPTSRRPIAAVAAGFLVIALVAAACSSSTTTSSANNAPAAAVGEHNLLPPVTSAAPVVGGTLKIVGSGDVDKLDTCCAYYTTTYEVLRALTRQLVSYQSLPSGAASNPVPDIATYSISSDGLTYTFNIKQGVMWDAPSGPRQVTSQDEVLGLKRLCNPVSPAPPLPYWTNNIAGMSSFCTGFQALTLPTSPTAEIAAIKSYIDNNQISGLSTPDASTLVIKLNHPASSFLNILAMPMSSPVPVEMLNYLPGSVQAEQGLISDGPYALASYTPNVGMSLTKNSAWNASTDPIRHQYFDAIQVTEGESATSVQQQLTTGDADLIWDTSVPTAQLPSLVAANNKQLVVSFIGGVTYLVFNMQSTSENSALKNVAVRQALQYCVNKRHIVQESGGPSANVAANQILPPQITGFQKIGPYPSTNSEGNPAKCKSMLAAAGYPNGLTLTLVYANNPPMPAQATALQNDFAAGGVTIKFNEQPSQGEYFNYVETPANKSNWDLAFGLWFPDWQGNGAQSFFSPLLDGRQYTTGSTDYGDYNDTTVDSDIDRALATASVSSAAAIWASADKYVMTMDPAWIPLIYMAQPYYIGAKVEHAEYNGFLGYVDITNLWKKK